MADIQTAESIYRLADKYLCEDLKNLARQRILKSIHASNVLEEMAEGFYAVFPEFMTEFEAYALDYWQEVSQRPGFAQALEDLLVGEHSRTACIAMMQKLARSPAGPAK